MPPIKVIQNIIFFMLSSSFKECAKKVPNTFKHKSF